MRCYSNPGYFVPLPENHPFPVEKYPELLRYLRLLELSELQFELALKMELDAVLRVHDADYIRSIEQQTLSTYARNRLGLPEHHRWLERSLLDVGGTWAATECALKEGIAWNLGGGTHHAMSDEGLGFCVLNDVAVAVNRLLDEQRDLRILVIDTDAHQGNGTHRILKGVDNVFTFSIHVGRNYPAVKEPGDLDVGLPRYVEGQHYLNALEQGLIDVKARFSPDVVFWVSGVDVLEADRFGQMRLSELQLAERDYQVLKFAKDIGAKLVGTLGGGYPEQRDQLAFYHAGSVLRSLEVFG